MNSQLAISFARDTDPEPSRDAAVAFTSEKRRMRDDIYRALELRPDGCIADELVPLFDGAERNSVCSRLNELRRQGLVKKAATKRHNQHGIAVTVWIRA